MIFNLTHTPMNQTLLTAQEQSVLKAVQKDHLTSFQILKKVDNVSMILSLYNVIDKLSNKGVLKSYMKLNRRYHYAS